MTSAMERCAWCHGLMDDSGDSARRRRRDRLTCSNRCRKALSRELKHEKRSNDSRAKGVTQGSTPYDEPPRPGESFYQPSVGDERFHRQLAQEAIRALPLTDEERQLHARAQRNIGVELPEFTQMRLDREYERMRLEAAEAARADPIRVQDQLDRSTYSHPARRAIRSRRNNKPVDPSMQVLRPPGRQSGPHPWDDEPQCIQAPVGRNTQRSMLPW